MTTFALVDKTCISTTRFVPSDEQLDKITEWLLAPHVQQDYRGLAKLLRKFTQDTALLNEQEVAQKFVDACSMAVGPETDEIVADSDEEDEPNRDDEIDHEEA
jgi:hypothetical protein